MAPHESHSDRTAVRAFLAQLREPSTDRLEKALAANPEAIGIIFTVLVYASKLLSVSTESVGNTTMGP